MLANIPFSDIVVEVLQAWNGHAVLEKLVVHATPCRVKTTPDLGGLANWPFKPSSDKVMLMHPCCWLRMPETEFVGSTVNTNMLMPVLWDADAGLTAYSLSG